MKPVLLLEILCEALPSPGHSSTGQEYPKHRNLPSSCSHIKILIKKIPKSFKTHLIFPSFHTSVSPRPECKALLRGHSIWHTGQDAAQDPVTSPRFRAWKRGGKRAGTSLQHPENLRALQALSLAPSNAFSEKIKLTSRAREWCKLFTGFFWASPFSWSTAGLFCNLWWLIFQFF